MTKPGYQISFSNVDNVSAWGGLALWAQFLKALRFRSQLARWSLPHPQSNRGYDPCLLVEQFVTNVLCGANRFCHMNTLRTDKATLRFAIGLRCRSKRLSVVFFNGLLHPIKVPY